MKTEITDKAGKDADGKPIYSFVLQVFWIAAQITLILWFGQKGYLFFYQGF